MAGYGGYQQGPARLYLDENGNQQVAYDDFEVSPQSDHQSVGAAFGRTAGQIMDPRKSMLPYLMLYASGVGAPAAAAAQSGGAGYTSGAALGSNAGYMSPALASGATNTAAGGLGSASFLGAGGAAPAASGMSALGTGTLAGSSIAPTAFGVSGAGVGLPASMAAGGGASSIPASIGNARYGTSLPGNATAASNPYSLSPQSYQGGQLGRDVSLNMPRGMNTPWYQDAGKALALKGAEAAPSLIMSAFMGGPARKQAAANLEATKTATMTAQQRNAYREWMRPMVEQAMRSMINRLPISMQGNLPQNFPQLQFPQSPR
jgi:hypothetical protein